MARSPETSAVAEAIRAAMKQQGLSGVELADRLEKIRGRALPYEPGVWVSKRTSGKIHLVRPARVVYEPTEELKQIAKALDVPVADLMAAIEQKRNVYMARANTADPTGVSCVDSEHIGCDHDPDRTTETPAATTADSTN